MAELSKQALKVENNTEFPNNNNGQITPSRLRGFNEDMIDSLVDEITYNADSASWNAQIAALDPSGSATSITALNAFTASADQRLDSLEAATSSYAISSSVAAVDAAQQAQIDSLIAGTGSYVTSAITASSLVTASFNNATRNLTFTKGDASTFAVNIPDASGSAGTFVTTSSFNAYTASTDSDLASIHSFTASADQRLDSIESVSGSWITEAETGSFVKSIFASITPNTFEYQTGDGTTTPITLTISAPTTDITALNNFTASQYVSNSFFATTGSNTFTGIQRFNAEITASNTLVNGDLTVFPNTSTKLNGNTDVQNFLYVGAGQTMGGQSVAITWLGSGSIDGTFSASVDARIKAITGSGTTNTGSLLVTASAAGADITFTKGDASQFTITVATGSAVSASYAETASLAINAKDIIVDAKNTTGAQLNKGTIVRIIGATGDNPLIGTASWTDDDNSANTLGFVVADIANDAFGRVMTQGTLLNVNTDPALGYTAGQLVYLSGSGQYTNVKPPAPYHEVRLGQVLRAQQNNGSIYVLVQNGYELTELHDVDINTGSLANNDLLAYDSASAQWINKSINGLGLATTGSNTFNGNQIVSGYVSASNGFFANDNTTTLTVGEGSNIRFISGSSYYNVQLVPSVGDMAFSRDGVSNVKVMTLAGAAGNSTTFQNNTVQIESTVPSFIVQAATQSFSASGNFSTTANTLNQTAVTAQLQASSSFIGTVGITGQSGNDGRAIMLGHSGSLVLGNSTTNTYYAAMNHISSSAANANTNLIFKTNTNTADTIISSSANIFTNPSAPTAGFKRYMTAGNIAIAGNGAAVPQISGSMAWSPTISNNILASSTNTITWRGPVSASASSINNNVLAGGSINLGTSATFTFERAVTATNILGNVINGNLSFTAYKTAFIGTAGMSVTNSNIGGATTLNADSSSISLVGSTIQVANFNVNNSYYNASATGTGNQLVVGPGNGIFGQSITLYASGSNTSTTVGRQVASNIIGGLFNSASVNLNGDNSSLGATAIIGNGLNVTGSSALYTAAPTKNNTYGSAFFGRFNAEDGNRAKTAETVFAIGTGTTSAAKTGFLIDSGSNTFVEGSLNVSGSTSFTGSLNVLSGSASGSVITNVSDTYTSTDAVTKIVSLTSAEYSGITPDVNTLYIII